jgi:Uma2 family endonuclease
MANAPAYDHQFAVYAIAGELRNFVSSKRLGVVLGASFEVHLPGIAKPVQPDVLFIAEARKPDSTTQVFEGAPDLIVEVLSPSSVRLDGYIKFGAYERAKVREYWIADPKTKWVEVFSLPMEGAEYVLLGQFGPASKIKSAVLTGLELAVESLFVG